MRPELRVIWSEGMMLSPQHFQQWDDGQDRRLEFRLASLSPFPWGLTDLEINTEAVANGRFEVLRCAGVLPGGTVFQSPAPGRPPLARVLRQALDTSARTVDVFLALASKSDVARNVADPGQETGRPLRYARHSSQVPDENTGENEREVQMAAQNLVLLFGGESLDGYDHLPIARVMQQGDGTFSLDDTYVPPCLRLQCSTVLMRVVRRLLEALHTKSTALSELRSQRTTGLLDFGSSDLGQAWLLTIVNSFIPALNHCARVPQIHPERLFESLARFAGQLTTFSPSTHPRDLPDYDHVNLSRTFLGLEKVIQELLKLVVPSGAVEIPLQRETDSKFSATILDEQLLTGSQLFLAARADVPEGQLIEELPRQAKISSAERIMSLLGLALPGIALAYQPAPPPALRVKLGLQYFRLESRGDPEYRKHWEYICSARSIAIRVPGQRFPGLRLELWAIKE